MKLIPPSKRTGLPLLLPGDPENALTLEARHRINRVIIESHRYSWETRISLRDRSIEFDSEEGDLELARARFKEADEILCAYRTEFSRLGLSNSEYRKLMECEIESIVASWQLSEDLHLNLFRTKFFLPEEQEPLPHTADFRQITYRGQIRRLTNNQARHVEALYAAWSDRRKVVSKQSLGDAIGTSGSEPRDSWLRTSNADLWDTLIQNDKKGSYWLQLP
jgi:hypothetical protein